LKNFIYSADELTKKKLTTNDEQDVHDKEASDGNDDVSLMNILSSLVAVADSSSSSSTTLPGPLESDHPLVSTLHIRPWKVVFVNPYGDDLGANYAVALEYGKQLQNIVIQFKNAIDLHNNQLQASGNGYITAYVPPSKVNCTVTFKCDIIGTDSDVTRKFFKELLHTDLAEVRSLKNKDGSTPSNFYETFRTALGIMNQAPPPLPQNQATSILADMSKIAASMKGVRKLF
jgi:hypothetical protein